MSRGVGTSTAFSFGLLIALVVVNAIIAYRNLDHLHTLDQQVTETHAVSTALQELLSAVKDAETGQRGFILTGRESYLKPYKDAVAVVKQRQERLHQLPDGGSLNPERLKALDDTVDAKFAELNQTIKLKKLDDLLNTHFGWADRFLHLFGPEGSNLAVAEVTTDRGRNLMTEIRDQVEQMSAEEQAALAKNKDQAQQSYFTTLGTTLLAACLSLAIVGFAIHLIRSELFARRRAEEDAHQQREWCLTTLTSIGDAVIVTGEDGRVKLLNPIAKRLTGWDESAIGQPLEKVFAIFNELTRLPVESPADKVLREGKVVGLANHTILRARDGRETPIDDSGAPIRNRDGHVTGVVLVFRDVTERRRSEADLLKHAAALQESDRRKDEFLAMLAHELRNPLAPIHNAVQILQLEGSHSENFPWSLAVIGDQTRHLTVLVDDLLDVSRITQGKVKLQTEPVDLSSILSRVVETCRPLLTEREHTLTVELGEKPIRLEADPTRLTQIFSNLLNNAAKYTPNGGSIALTAAVEGNEVVVRVRDNGMGIAPEIMPRIFDLFAQGDKSLARTSGGLGIGLTLVRRLVELLGGSVAAYSEGTNQGSEFVVRLPLVDPLPPPLKVAAPAPPESAGRRILLVDDNQDSSRSLAVLLRAAGGEVELAFDGPSALEAALRAKPDVVLLDIGLPGMDGYEVAQRLRKEVGLEKTLLIAITGYGGEDDRRRSQEAGFNAHLVKPVDLAALQTLLARSPFVAEA